MGAIETDNAPEFQPAHTKGHENATALLGTVERPVVAVTTEPAEEYEYEVLVFDLNRQRRLFAAIELVSPANKDRPQSRKAFVAKCSALLRKGIAVSLVDLMTIRRLPGE